QQCRELIMPLAGSPVARQWLEATEPVGFSDDTLVLATPHSFAREWLDLKVGDGLRTQLSQAAGRTLHVVITVQPGGASLAPGEASEPAADPAGAAHPVATAVPYAPPEPPSAHPNGREPAPGREPYPA